jgi:hypothetical protein
MLPHPSPTALSERASESARQTVEVDPMLGWESDWEMFKEVFQDS